ncbi:amino acid/amide ABC transporter membrane protein 2, HAAT family [Rhizobiales bacterium GAS113]|nr:amino acid/amide ABC transporter membrane protein 2, HAAT family [Rhizobiales bacterium GAS113]
MGVFNPAFWIFVSVIAGIYTIMALGLYVQFSLAGLPNFGHVAFMAVAAYAMAILVIRYQAPLIPASLAGLAAAVVLAFILGVPTLRLRADYLAIATVAGGEIIRYLAMNLPDLTGGPVGSMAMLGPTKLAMYNGGWQAMLDGMRERLAPLLGFAPSRDAVSALIVWVLAVALLLLMWRLERSPWGRVQKGIREDDVAVAAVGKNVVAFKMQALVLGAVLGGLAGLLLAFQIGVFSPDDYQPTLTFYAYLILILGGMNRLWAIPLGAVLFSLLYAGTRFLNFFPLSLFDSGSRAFVRLFLVGFLLVLFMALRPQGLLGSRRELLLEK